MRSKAFPTLVAGALAVVLSWGWAGGASVQGTGLRLPALFADHMVLQREMEVPVWGSAAPGDEIAIEIAGQRKVAVADENGDWRTTLDPLPAGGPHELVVQGDHTLHFSDVLVGEVWLASGQSNMEMPLAGWGRILDFEAEIARADYPEIRLFHVEHTTAMRPQSDVETTGWKRCSPESVAEFSSTAYFFGRRVYREIGIPVGLVHSSWGGTVAEAWTSAGTLEGMDDFREAVGEVKSTTAEDIIEMRRAFDDAMASRQRALIENDEGMEDGSFVWAGVDVDDSGWSTMDLPTKWEDADLPELDGVVWFRRRVELPASWVNSELVLTLGPIDDGDETFFNGVSLGSTYGWDMPRRYKVPADLVRAGGNVITVRVWDPYYSGGLWGEPKDLNLEEAGGAGLSLAGPWSYKVGLDLGELEPLPISPDEPNRPTVLFNGMISPLVPYAIRGAIWYQGESNSSRAYQYRTLFPALIRDWRTIWGQGDFPFYFVQLAAFEPGPLEAGAWAELREAQAMALSLPATGMAVAIDIGTAADVHPKNKQEVGNRLARLALKRVYGEEIVDSGPLYRQMSREESRIRLAFDHAQGGLEAKGGALTGFTLAGEDQAFFPAEARIEDDTVVVWSGEVSDPVAVRYGWADNPDCNLYNAAGLPASPFRTDAWPGITEGAGKVDER
ncbi:MAG: 9-O-acetylesterase [Acidobacteriota bacterium]|nr:9-O-acetylesterase [Acidobacteriota bacterium]